MLLSTLIRLASPRSGAPAANATSGPSAPAGATLSRNEAAALFRQLAAAWNRDAGSHRVDVLAAELASLVARAHAPLCLGMIERTAVPRYYGLVFLLDGYGVMLRKRYRSDGLAAYVYAEPKGPAAVENAGTVVRELEPPLAHAA